MTTLLVGFDSAWTAHKSGALVGLLSNRDGTFHHIGLPQIADFAKASVTIRRWQSDLKPTTTLVMLDQPTIVVNDSGQRPVENIVSSAISLRFGGMQPASVSRTEMFGKGAPIWPFLDEFGGAVDPRKPTAGIQVFETYPALALIALGWLQSDPRPTGRLPKYNQANKKKFNWDDWKYVCDQTSGEFKRHDLRELGVWLDALSENPSPRKPDQDRLDACLCLLVAIFYAQGRSCIMVGNTMTGYIVLPHSPQLLEELAVRCGKTLRCPPEWICEFKHAPKEADE